MNLNINADLMVALKLKNNTWEFFDVYNQAARHNGMLIVKNYKYFSLQDTTPKYISRRNMTGVLFKSSIVAS